MDEEFKNQEHIDDLRKRLYARNPESSGALRHELNDTKIDVARDWGTGSVVQATTQTSTPEASEEPAQLEEQPAPKKRGYRRIVLIGSLLIFVITAVVSSAYLYFGGNQISSQNIGVNIAGPNAIGGGEDISLQVGISNQNQVALESVTLIVKYPSGTRTTEEPIENLYEERIWIDTLDPGEIKNIPVRATIYGEEGDEKEINASLEYRISGSNGTFYKDSEPHTLRIVSSPVVMSVRSVRKVASGQEVEVEIEVKSNTTNSFNNLLVSASYPSGFSFKSASPEPAYNQNVWTIDELEPEETELITLRGTLTGLNDELLRLKASVGPAETDNQFRVGASLAESYTEFLIEKPFLDVQVQVNDDTDNDVTLMAGQRAIVRIDVSNTLDESIYDMVVEVVPSGTAFQNASIESGDGFYDSNTGVITWETSNVGTFGQVLPGDFRLVEFNIIPGAEQSTASFDLAVNVYGRRVAEPSAQEQLVGTVTVEGRYSSNVDISGQANVVSGPVPPKVGEATRYAVALVAEAGVNDVTNGIVTAQLPVYVKWLDDYAAEGTVNFNPVNQQLEWRVGNIDGGKQKDLVFTVELLPSSSQVGINPVLVNRQTFTARDRFTSGELEADASRITTEYASPGPDSGRVVAD